MLRLAAFAACLLVVILALMGGCGADISGSGAPSLSGPLNASELNELNSLRRSSFEPDGVSPTDDIVEDAALDTDAIKHSGYNSSLTATDLAVVDAWWNEATHTTYPLYTGGNPDARSGTATTWEFSLASPFQSGSRVATLWYSRKGRIPLINRSFTKFGWGSITQAIALNAAVPVEGTSPFMDNAFDGTFVFVDTAVPLRTYSFWPSSTQSAAPTPVFAFSSHVEGAPTPPGTDLPLNRVVKTSGSLMLDAVDNTKRTVGFPIHVAMNAAVDKVVTARLWGSSTLGGPFSILGTAPRFDVYSKTNTITLPAAAQGMAWVGTTSQADSGYLDSELFFVPVDGFSRPVIPNGILYFKLELGLHTVGNPGVVDAPIFPSAFNPAEPPDVTVVMYFYLAG